MWKHDTWPATNTTVLTLPAPFTSVGSVTICQSRHNQGPSSMKMGCMKTISNCLTLNSDTVAWWRFAIIWYAIWARFRRAWLQMNQSVLLLCPGTTWTGSVINIYWYHLFHSLLMTALKVLAIAHWLIKLHANSP